MCCLAKMFENIAGERLLRIRNCGGINHRVSSITCSLHLKHGGISAAERNEFGVAAFFHNAAGFKHNNAVCHTDGRKAMGNNQGHLAEGEFGKALKDFELTTSIE